MQRLTAHVYVTLEGRWGVMKSTSQRASKVFDSRPEAIRHGRTLAKRNGIVLYIHNDDGTVKSVFKPTAPASK